MPPKKGSPKPDIVNDDSGQEFRTNALDALTTQIGVYALCDLNGVPIYVGKSTDGIRTRVRRHLTSARSDIVANRSIDVWEVAWVWAWPMPEKSLIKNLEAYLFHKFDPQSRLMNGALPIFTELDETLIPEKQILKVMPDSLIVERQASVRRLPRQIAHYAQLVDYLLVVKDKPQVRRSLSSHFERLSRYHLKFLSESSDVTFGDGEAEANEE